MKIKKCIHCYWFLEQKDTLINYCMMKQSFNEFPDVENNCVYWAFCNKE